jgi:hypothetical protein
LSEIDSAERRANFSDADYSDLLKNWPVA